MTRIVTKDILPSPWSLQSGRKNLKLQVGTKYQSARVKEDRTGLSGEMLLSAKV